MKRTPMAARKAPLASRAPLARGEGLKRSTAPLAPGKGLSREARLAPRSEKRAREYAQPGGRRDLVAATLKAEPRCQAQVLCRGARTVDVHERLSRARGGSILDPVQGHHLAVCRACHDWIGDNPTEAERRRLALPSWHRCPQVGPC